MNTPTEINKISNYAHIGTQLASVMAYDPIDNHLIRNYAIFYSSFDESVSSQVKIDQETGGFLFCDFEKKNFNFSLSNFMRFKVSFIFRVRFM